jgi:hypothetical protein
MANGVSRGEWNEPVYLEREHDRGVGSECGIFSRAVYAGGFKRSAMRTLDAAKSDNLHVSGLRKHF